MKKYLIFILLFTFVCLVPSCNSKAETLEPEAVQEEAPLSGTLETFSFHSNSLEGNLFGDNPERSVKVYLPPGYDPQGEKRYAVIYYLSGFGIGSYEIFSNYARANHVMDQGVNRGELEPCIIVGIGGNNRFGGGFYANSPVSGNWEDFVVEVISQIDQNYLTLAQKESRGITGFSMGGFGSLYVGLRNAHLFQAVHAYSPGLFDETGFNESVWETWKDWGNVLRAYGAVFTPHEDPQDRDSFDYPAPGSNAQEVVAQWNSLWSYGYGDAEGKIDAYLAGPSRLAFIQVDYAANDDYPWLREGSQHFYQVLQDRGIPSGQRVVPDYSHWLDDFIVKNYILSFFNEHLIMD